MSGFTTYKNITMTNVTEIANVSDYPSFMINISNSVYDGWLFFILLWVVWFIIFKKAQERNDDFMVNAMVSFSIITVISFFMRAITIVKNGIVYGLLTDIQFWIFPLLAIFLAVVIYANDKE